MLDSLDLQLQQFERIDATSATALLRLDAGWRANHERRLSPPVLVICDERRTHRIAALPGPDDAAPVAGPDAPGWCAAYPVPIELVEQSSATFAIDTGRGVFALPRPRIDLAHEEHAARLQREETTRAEVEPRLMKFAEHTTELEEQLRLTISGAAEASAGLADELAVSRREQAAVQAQLDAARAHDEDARAELDPIRAQLRSLAGELEASHIEREEQQVRLAVLFEQHRDLATRLDEMATERDREHAEKVRLRDELSARLVAMENERGAAQEELAQIAGQRREEVRARKQAAERLEHVVRQRGQLTLRLAESTAAADAARREAATAEDAVARLQRRIAELEEAELQAPTF